MRNRSHMADCRCSECSGDDRGSAAMMGAPLFPPAAAEQPERCMQDDIHDVPPSLSGPVLATHPQAQDLNVRTGVVGAAVAAIAPGSRRLVLVVDEGPPGLHLYSVVRVRRLAPSKDPSEALTATVVGRAMTLAQCQTGIMSVPGPDRVAGDQYVILQLARVYEVGAAGDLTLRCSGGEGEAGVPVVRNHLA